MIAVGVDVGDKINRELRRYGANLVVYPADAALSVRIGDQELKPASGGTHLKESSLSNIRGIFWGHNILAFAPFLETQLPTRSGTIRVIGTYFDKQLRFGTEEFSTGVEKMYPWWKVQGSWPTDGSSDLLIGSQLASRIGNQVGDSIDLLGSSARIRGILTTGGAEDNAIVAPLALVQQLLHAPDAVDKIYVSALTKPEDAFARRDPERMTAADRDRWYCSPYANSIAPPVVRMPRIRALDPSRSIESPTCFPIRDANCDPISKSLLPSVGQLPCTFHHGYIFSTPVENSSVPKRSCLSKYVPITRIVPDRVGNCVSRKGANARMLWPQKIPLMLDREDSLR